MMTTCFNGCVFGKQRFLVATVLGLAAMVFPTTASAGGGPPTVFVGFPSLSDVYVGPTTLKHMDLIFSENVFIPNGSIRILRAARSMGGVTQVAPLPVTVTQPAGFAARVTFPQVAGDRLLLVIDHTVVSQSSGMRFDGDGDGEEGGQAFFPLTVLLGDVNRDGVRDAFDTLLFEQARFCCDTGVDPVETLLDECTDVYNPMADFNNNGCVDSADGSLAFNYASVSVGVAPDGALNDPVVTITTLGTVNPIVELAFDEVMDTNSLGRHSVYAVSDDGSLFVTPVSAPMVSNGNQTFTFTLAAVPVGDYTLHISGAIRDLRGTRLDAEMTFDFTENDTDGDGEPNDTDNCPDIAGTDPACCNPTAGDDLDDDGVGIICDNCPIDSNADQLDTDGDGMGDACDDNDDNDAFDDVDDNCPLVANDSQADADGDDIGDACDPNDDNDAFDDDFDNCPLVANDDQMDSDCDGVGDACDTQPELVFTQFAAQYSADGAQVATSINPVLMSETTAGVIYTIRLENVGTGRADNIEFVSELPEGLDIDLFFTALTSPSFPSDLHSLELDEFRTPIPGLNPGAAFDMTLILPVSQTAADCAELINDTVRVEPTSCNAQPDVMAGSATATNDETPPTFSCGDLMLGNDAGTCNAVVTTNSLMSVAPGPNGFGGISDNCDPSPSVTCLVDGDDPDAVEVMLMVGQTAATVCTVTDASGNSADCMFDVTVIDTEAPTIETCPEAVSVDDLTADCVEAATFMPTVTDNCPNAMLNCDATSGNDFPVGTTAVTCTAMDASGNPATDCSFDVEIVDVTAPTILCDDVMVDLDESDCQTAANFDIVVDDCSGEPTVVCERVSDSQAIDSGDNFDVGETEITCTATDAASLTDTCTFMVTVNDTEDPIITCPSDISSCETMVTVPNVTATDCDSSVTIDCTPDMIDGEFNFPDDATTEVTCVATDNANNSAMCAFDVEVIDDMDPPVITCPANVTVNVAAGVNDTAINVGVATATDNCDDTVTIAGQRDTGDMNNLNAPYPAGETTTITWTATDDDGNDSTCTQTVTVNTPEDSNNGGDNGGGNDDGGGDDGTDDEDGGDDIPTATGTVGATGSLRLELSSDDGSTRVVVDITRGLSTTNGRTVTLNLYMNDGAPGLPDGATYEGFLDQLALGATIEVDTNLTNGQFRALKQITVPVSTLTALGLTAADVDVHVLDEDAIPQAWEVRGTNYQGQTTPTEASDIGDYGYTVSGGEATFWVVCDGFSVFAIGQSLSGPSVVRECDTNADCNDGAFCNGAEVCDGDGACTNGVPPCAAGQVCDEATDACRSCVDDSECDDDLFCNGVETCGGNGACILGVAVVCGADESCDEATDACVLDRDPVEEPPAGTPTPQGGCGAGMCGTMGFLALPMMMFGMVTMRRTVRPVRIRS